MNNPATTINVSTFKKGGVVTFMGGGKATIREVNNSGKSDNYYLSYQLTNGAVCAHSEYTDRGECIDHNAMTITGYTAPPTKIDIILTDIRGSQPTLASHLKKLADAIIKEARKPE